MQGEWRPGSAGGGRSGGAGRPSTHQMPRMTQDVSMSGGVLPAFFFLPSFQGEIKPPSLVLALSTGWARRSP